MSDRFERARRIALIAMVMLGASLASGCASIVSGTNQVISVQTVKGNTAVAGAACQLTNDKGTYFVTTPGTVSVHRAYGDMSIKCDKEGMETGLVSAKSNTKAMMAGNIIFGGVIGAAVDAGTGAAYDYPELITVLMGQSGTVGISSVPSTPPEGVTPATAAPPPTTPTKFALPPQPSTPAAPATPVTTEAAK